MSDTPTRGRVTGGEPSRPTTLGARADPVNRSATSARRPIAGGSSASAPSGGRLLAPTALACTVAALGAVASGVAGAQEASGETARDMLIPRAAIVDMTRAQSRVICTSEPFLDCMGFDSGECFTLAESAIERCLMPLPAEIDPTKLDSDTLEACPRELYAEAGYEEAQGNACFARAIEAESGEAPAESATGGAPDTDRDSDRDADRDAAPGDDPNGDAGPDADEEP